MPKYYRKFLGKQLSNHNAKIVRSCCSEKEFVHRLKQQKRQKRYKSYIIQNSEIIDCGEDIIKVTFDSCKCPDCVRMRNPFIFTDPFDENTINIFDDSSLSVFPKDVLKYVITPYCFQYHTSYDIYIWFILNSQNYSNVDGKSFKKFLIYFIKLFIFQNTNSYDNPNYSDMFFIFKHTSFYKNFLNIVGWMYGKMGLKRYRNYWRDCIYTKSPREKDSIWNWNGRKKLDWVYKWFRSVFK